MKLLKLALLVLIICVEAFGFQDKQFKWAEDLDGDGKKEQIEMYHKDRRPYLKINSADFELASSEIIAIADEKNKDNLVFFADFDYDGRKEIAVTVGHPLFTNKSIFRIFKYKNNKIEPMKFYYGLDLDEEDHFKELICLEILYVIIDSNTNGIYYVSGKAPYNTEDGETIFLYEVDLYKWSKSAKRIIKMGEKYFDTIDKKNLPQLIF